MGSRRDEFLWELGVEVQPRQASVLVCVVLAGTSERLVSPRVLEGAHCRCCGTSDLARSILVEIFHHVEGGFVEQVYSNLETILSCLRLLISFSLTCVYISCMLILFISLICLIPCASYIYLLGIVCLHLYSIKRAIVTLQLLI